MDRSSAAPAVATAISGTPLLVALAIGLSAMACSNARHFLGGEELQGTAGTGGSDGDASTEPDVVYDLCIAGADFELIDDMEDGDSAIMIVSGRAGTWYSFDDKTEGGVQEPSGNADFFPMTALDPPRGKSQYAARTHGGGFTDWGAGMAADLLVKTQYDASAYAGISFVARSGRPGTTVVRVDIPDHFTTPQGRVCESGVNCYDNFGVDVMLSNEWQRFDFEWSDLKQKNWSGQNLKAIDSSRVYSVRFQVDANVNFDFWVDDLAFICPR